MGATYDFHVADFGGSKTWTVTARGGAVGDLTGATFSVRVVANGRDKATPWTAGFTGLTASRVQFVTPNSTYWDAQGTWILHIRYTLGSVTETLDPITLSIGPAGGTAAGSVAGATTATGLNAQIAALASTATADNPRWIVLPDGTITLDAVLQLASHVHLRAEYPGATRLTRSDAPAVGLADDPTNAVMLAAPTATAITCELTSLAAGGDTALIVDDTTGFATGDWILLDWIPGDAADGGDALAESGPERQLHALYKVASVPDGTHLNLVSPVEGYHPTVTATTDGTTVTKVTPVEDVRIEGLAFDCSGGSIACGVSLRSCADVHVTDCSFEGFSRAGVNVDNGTREWSVVGYHRIGETCADVMAQSTLHGLVERFTSAPFGTRCHANGIPRHAITLRLRNISITVRNCDIQNAQGGVSIWGDWNDLVTGVRVRDCDPTERQARAAATELDAGLAFGVGLDLGTTSVTNSYTSFTSGLVINGLHVEDVTTPNGSWSVYLHDSNNCKARDITVINRGRSTGAAAARAMNGVVISDVGGNSVIDGLHIVGVGGAALEFQNAGFTGGGTLRNLYVNIGAGTVPNVGTVGIYFNTDGNGTSYTLLEDVRINNYATQWTFGAGFVMYGLRVKNLVFDGVWRQVDECIVVRNNAGATFNPYSLGELSNGGAGTQQVYVVASGGTATPKNVVIYSATAAPTSATFLLVGVTGKGKHNTIRTARDSAIDAGDLLVAGANGNAVVDNAANGEDVVGIALTNYALSGGATAQVPTA